jgi:hypothetical protein
MSWQDYVDKQLLGSGCIREAAICGLDGNVWARSGTFSVSLSKFELSFFCADHSQPQITPTYHHQNFLWDNHPQYTSSVSHRVV